jgi:hypothetical protein
VVLYQPAENFDVVLDGGSRLPDFLFCGFYPYLVASETVVRIWREAGIHMGAMHKIGVAGLLNKRVKLAEVPQYYQIEILGRARVHLSRSGYTNWVLCEQCDRLIKRVPAVTSQTVLIEGTWDGRDLFRDAQFSPTMYFCTSRVIQLAKEHKLTNLEAEPVMFAPERFP